jgi:hypothetical protein
VGESFGFDYEVPRKVLLASAHRKIIDNRKGEALELLIFAEEKYGASDRIAELKAGASKLNDVVDPLIEFYLNHPKPSADEIKPYVGRWVGELIVPRGHAMPVDFSIKIENGKTKGESITPWPPFKKVEMEIFFVDKEGSLITVRKNRGGGIVVSIARIASDGNLVGEEKMIGFTIPEDAPEDVKEMMKFTLANPNTFVLKRAK